MRSEDVQHHAVKGRRWLRWLVTLLIWGAALGLVRLATASVSLLYFRGTTGENVVNLEWATGNELTLAGFNVWRRQDAATPRPGETPGVRLNNQGVIPPASGGAQGATYWFTDTTVVNGTPYWYWLEWLDTQPGGNELRENADNPLVPGGPVPPTRTPGPPPPPPVTPTPGPTDTPAPTETATPPLPPTATLPGATASPTAVPPATATPFVPPTFTSPLATPPPLVTSPVPSPTAGLIIGASPTPLGSLLPTASPSGPRPATVTPILVTRVLPFGSPTPLIGAQRGTLSPSARATATALAIARAQGGQQPGTQTVGPEETGDRRLGLILIGVSLIGLVGLGTLGYLFWRWSRPATPPGTPPAGPAGLIGPPPPPEPPSSEPETPTWEERDWRRPGSPLE